MAYRLSLDDRDVDAALCRIAGEQLAKAAQAMDGMEPALAVHDIRKRCKKLRALIRLVRPAFPDYRYENADFREIAALISGARDARVMLDTYDRLEQAYADEVDRRSFRSIRARLETDHAGCEADNGLAALKAARERLLAAKKRVARWRLTETAWAALGPGLAASRKQARASAGLASTETVPEAIHELRKHIKYHCYHARLLMDLWPDCMGLRERSAMEASELLGLHHDLWVFECRLARDGEGFGKPSDVALARSLAARERDRLEALAWPLINRLLAEKPGALMRHWGRLWAVWRANGAGGA